MHPLATRIHHFTKRELATEEFIVIAVVCLFALAALAATAILPIRATIVQCGSRDQLPASCHEDQRCCVLLGNSAPSNQNMPGTQEIDLQKESRTDIQ